MILRKKTYWSTGVFQCARIYQKTFISVRKATAAIPVGILESLVAAMDLALAA
ncbi:hypothetical protein KPSA1_06964 [Pseudomonas syringae pv. actinidiae]|uniref:Uncharacterized protein n=1 Tax=Pseudomonas syringae pv. actinidiae TaxID=103796 RepID=A0A2V0QTA7_PSESF|nr:hypothetical protein KPSA1_06964 [Pseudomonas syringae pv. actinidiae]